MTCTPTSIDLAREETFEAPDDLTFGAAVGRTSHNVVDRWLVVPHAADDRQISSEDQRSVKLRVRSPPTGTHQCHRVTPDRRRNHAHSQVDEKLVDLPPRYWARARREPTMLGIRNGRQTQLDNTPQSTDPLSGPQTNVANDEPDDPGERVERNA